MKLFYQILPFLLISLWWLPIEIHASFDHPDSQFGKANAVQGGVNLFMTTDFIYWTARMDGLSYVTSGFGNYPENVSPGTVSYPDWNWNPGFKVGLGYHLPHDQWEINVQYTWLRSSAFDSEEGNTLDFNWNISDFEKVIAIEESFSGFIESAQSDWKLRYHIIDLELGRPFLIKYYLSLRPHFGFKTSWQDIDYTVRYQSSRSAAIETRLQMKNNTDFWGIGIRTGLNTAWKINPIFSIYGNCALSALWSYYHIKRRDKRKDLRNEHPNSPIKLNTNITTYHTDKDFHTLKGIVEFSIGLRGEYWSLNDRYHVLGQAGWEEQIWINHNQLIKMHSVESAHGDLILQGFTMKFCFDF